MTTNFFSDTVVTSTLSVWDILLIGHHLLPLRILVGWVGYKGKDVGQTQAEKGALSLKRSIINLHSE